jgi:ribosomal protein L11 methylase PrmA
VSARLRSYELAGPAAAVALDWLHVHCELQGVHERDDGAVQVWLHGALPALPHADLTVRELPVHAADFEVTGLEGDRPILVADDLLVRPPWVERPADFRGVELVVPRGSAFGSGEHASTQAALRCLHRGWDAPASFADVGTGSGILALYAAARGCANLQACDIEGPAVVAAQALLPQATVRLGGAELLAPADCVVANLTAAELHAALPAVLACWRRTSSLVLGGMRAHEVEGVLARLDVEPVYRETIGAFTAVVLRPDR